MTGIYPVDHSCHFDLMESLLQSEEVGALERRLGAAGIRDSSTRMRLALAMKYSQAEITLSKMPHTARVDVVLQLTLSLPRLVRCHSA